MDETAYVLRIIDAVSQLTGIKAKEIRGNSRIGQVSRARFTAQYLARTQTSLSFPAIGQIFGERNHATVISAVNKETMLLSRGALFAGRIPMKEWHAQVLRTVDDMIKAEIAASVAAAGVATVAEPSMPPLQLVPTQVLSNTVFPRDSDA